MSSKILNISATALVGALAIAGVYTLYNKYIITNSDVTDNNDDLEEKLGKMSYYDIPESPLDDLPVIRISKDLLERVRVSINNLDGSSLESSKFFSSLTTHGFAVVELPSRVIIQDAEEKMKEFFKVSNLQTYHTNSTTPNGYKKLYFPNRENKRDPEERDVFQVYKGNPQYNKLNWHSSDLKEKCEKAYDYCYNTALKLISVIAMNLKVDQKEIISHLKPSENGVGTEESNLVFFHYEDKRGYSTTQKCMVHQDESFITILPKSTFPGIHIFDPSTQSWLDIESSLKENEVIVYCGRALSLITNDLIPATTHRVVRQPQKERYSCPFQLKPHTMAKLDYLKSPIIPLYPPLGKTRFGYANDEIVLPKTMTEVKNIISWEKIQVKLARISQKEKNAIQQENHKVSEDDMESIERE